MRMYVLLGAGGSPIVISHKRPGRASDRGRLLLVGHRGRWSWRRQAAPLGSETRTSCCGLVVLVNQAPEAIPPPNAVGERDNGRCWCSSDLATARRAELKASVRSLVVVVAHVLIEDPLLCG